MAQPTNIHPMADEPVIYREEVLTIMAVLGDQRAELEQIRRLLEGEDGEEEAEVDLDD